MKDVELVVPVCAGTIAFWLGKRATETASHKWTVYLRSATSEDLSHVISKVVFILHNSFQVPTRDVLQPPFQVSETGWGEFDIIVQIHFADDAEEKPVELTQSLKLYSENEPQPTSTKKAVINELYEEIVFHQPSKAFYERVKAHIPRPAPTSSLDPHFLKYSDLEEVERIQAAQVKVDEMTASLRHKLEMFGGV